MGYCLVGRRVTEMNLPFTAETRNIILKDYNALMLRKDELEFQGIEGKRAEDPSFGSEIASILETFQVISRKYLNGLPKIPVSRCPFSGETVVHSLDIFGIDGLWWNYEAPIRPVEALPRTFHSMSGAVTVRQPVEKTSFVVHPGPDIPFVIPGLLAYPSVVAVLSSVRIGPHIGYPICYFSSDPGSVDFLVNSWGASERLEGQGMSERGWSNRELKVEEMDFNLEPWIRSEKLGWIEPGDSQFEIKTSLDDCPYLGLEGTKRLQTLFGGRIVYG